MYTLIYSFCRKEATLYVLDGHFNFDSAVHRLNPIENVPFYDTCDCCQERWRSWRVGRYSEVLNMTHVLPNNKVVYRSEIGRFVMERKESE